VSEDDIRRRFNRGLKNLLAEYHPLLDAWTILDNSGSLPQITAHAQGGDIRIIDAALFHQIKSSLELP
jgi:predicted ABC-type ATPase